MNFLKIYNIIIIQIVDRLSELLWFIIRKFLISVRKTSDLNDLNVTSLSNCPL